MLHGRLSAMLGARSILDSVTPSCEGRPPAGPRGPLPHLRAQSAARAFPAPSSQEGQCFEEPGREIASREGRGVSVIPPPRRYAPTLPARGRDKRYRRPGRLIPPPRKRGGGGHREAMVGWGCCCSTAETKTTAPPAPHCRYRRCRSCRRTPSA